MKRIAIRRDNRYFVYNQEEIRFIVLSHSIVKVFGINYLGDLHNRTLDEVMEILDPDLFWRCHRSAIVNVMHVDQVIWMGGACPSELVMNDKLGTKIEASRDRRGEYRRWLEGLPLRELRNEVVVSND